MLYCCPLSCQQLCDSWNPPWMLQPIMVAALYQWKRQALRLIVPIVPCPAVETSCWANMRNGLKICCSSEVGVPTGTWAPSSLGLGSNTGRWVSDVCCRHPPNPQLTAHAFSLGEGSAAPQAVQVWWHRAWWGLSPWRAFLFLWHVAVTRSACWVPFFFAWGWLTWQLPEHQAFLTRAHFPSLLMIPGEETVEKRCEIIV